MARQKKPENETPEEKRIRVTLEKVSNFSNRSEKTSWNRKLEKMTSLLATLAPIQDKIFELQAQKTPILDEVHEIREVMVDECVHPYEYLVLKEDHILCKFCDKKISIPTDAPEEKDI